MDRPISSSETKKQQLGQYAKIAGGLALLGLVAYLVWAWLVPSVPRQLLRTAIVDKGEVMATINASGTVVPEFEQFISSPIDTRILKVLRRAGDSLRAQEPIMMLDIDYLRISIRKNYDQLALKSNALAQLKATYKSQLIKVQSQLKNKELDVQYKQLEYQQQQTLFEKKAIAKNDFLLKELAYVQAKNELEELDNTVKNLRESMDLQEEGLRLEISILQSELQLLEQQLKQADMRTERPGILTWIITTEGASIQKGQTLAKIADLSAYRIEAKVSDVHASSIFIGMPVRAKVQHSGQEMLLEGEVSNITPTIENGIMNVQVKLNIANHAALRPNLRVDVFLVKDFKTNVLRLRKPIILTNEGRSEVFVLREGKAIRTAIEIGARSSDMVEIITGLQLGDEVIISDMNEYKHASQISVK